MEHDMTANTLTAPKAAPVPEPQPVAQPAPAPQRRSRGINLAPKAEAKACRYGTKQADLLFRSGGASMAPWKDIKSGLGWDMNHQKGYGIRTTHENGCQRWLATDYAGMGTFRGDSHPDDLSEADNLVLPAGMTAPVPHTVADKLNHLVFGDPLPTNEAKQ